MNPLGVITGITREADCLTVFPAHERPLVRCSGASSDRAHAVARELIAEGCRGLLSFGTAGGLKPGLTPGTVIVADMVIEPGGGTYPTSAPWRERLRQALEDFGSVRVAPLAGSDSVVAQVAAKRALGEAASALGVDMESHAVAAAADGAGIPFLAVRAIADPLGRAIPDWVLSGITEEGSVDHGAVIAGLFRNPWDLPALIGLAGESAKAIRSLRRVARRAGPFFGFE